MNDFTSVLTIFIIIIGLFALIIFIAPTLSSKAKKVGDGQHGDARFMTKEEKIKKYEVIEFTPDLWRKGKNLPSKDKQGIIVGLVEDDKKSTFVDFMDKITIKKDQKSATNEYFKAYVETADIHTGIYAGTGHGKTAFFLYPNLEYACACGMSFFTTDTKGDLYRNYGYIAKEYYGYNISILDLRNPVISSGNNILSQVNKYMDISKNPNVSEADRLAAKAKSEKYARLTADSIVNSDEDNNYGANKYFYDAANSLLTSVILLVSEFGKENERHIASVFTLLTELLEYVPYGNSQEMRINGLLRMLPTEHRAKLFATTATAGADQAKLSVVTTALSKLINFIDTEIEQMLCFENDIDIEKFCTEKSAIFVTLPEEDTTKYFLVSLLLQQFYREILIYADKLGGKLKNKAIFFMDEIGTCPKISGLDMMFSAIRSRGAILVPIMQSPSQMRKRYGDDSTITINSNLMSVLYGGFAPESELTKKVSEAIGNVTVTTASVSQSSLNPFADKNIQTSMTGKPLMSERDLENMPQGHFVLRRTGQHPFVTEFKLYKKWGITFDNLYNPPSKQLRKVSYLSADELERRIEKSMIDKALKEQMEKNYNKISHHKDIDNADEQHFFSDFDADEV